MNLKNSRIFKLSAVLAGLWVAVLGGLYLLVGNNPAPELLQVMVVPPIFIVVCGIGFTWVFAPKT